VVVAAVMVTTRIVVLMTEIIVIFSAKCTRHELIADRYFDNKLRSAACCEGWRHVDQLLRGRNCPTKADSRVVRRRTLPLDPARSEAVHRAHRSLVTQADGDGAGDPHAAEAGSRRISTPLSAEFVPEDVGA
jgi:hypothetical protein